MARSDDADARAARWEKEAHDLSTQVAFLQEELALVRRKLTESPRHVRQLEERLAATQAQLARLTENNERLVATLKEARAQIVTLKEEVDRLAQPPSGYGVFLARHEDGTVDVFTGGRKLRVAVSPVGRGRRAAARPGGPAQRRAQHRRRARVRAGRRGGHAQGDPATGSATGRWSSPTPTRSGSSTSPTR